MAGAALLLIVVVAAIAVLLGCLRGFSRALKHSKTPALLLRVDETPGGGQFRRVREPLLFPRNAGPGQHTTLTASGISKNTAAFVGIALLLGSRSADFDKQTRTWLQPHRDKKTREAKATLWSRGSLASLPKVNRTICCATLALHVLVIGITGSLGRCCCFL
jgi:hypothetical protein